MQMNVANCAISRSCLLKIPFLVQSARVSLLETERKKAAGRAAGEGGIGSRIAANAMRWPAAFY
ncbi:hypothetical protein D0B32_28090 [Paraburkholderia sp. DHOC27]|nr:hypothetical protein D0B32_28090 [Paraburkholderia sp. DHOC27]